MNQPLPPADAEKEQRLNGILAEYLKRKDAGKPVSKASLLKAYPDLADGLRSYFEGEAMIGGLAVAPTKLSPKPVPADVRETVKPGAMESDTSSGFSPRSFGRYQLLRPLGEGAMGSVFLANDTTLDRHVALKVPKTEGTSKAEFMARFTREAKAAAGLKHPNICSVYDAGEHNGTAYITMDFIDGVPLSRFIGSRKLQSLDSILKMLTVIAEAVGHAHSKGVIHRDLKPGNILVDAELNPHVTDFGLARRSDPSDESRITQEGLLIGTPAYMAPEQVKGEQAKVGPQSDIYSLGVILFEMLTCRLPFDGSVPEMLAKVLRDTPPVPSRIRKDLPEDVDDLCLKMLKKLPEQRYLNIAEVLTAIGKLQKKIRKAPVPTADVARQQSPFEIQKAHVEAMLKKGQYAAAIQDLEKLAAEKSPGAKAVAEWAQAKLPVVRAESKSLNPEGLAALLKTAEQMFQKSDYQGVMQLLEDVPALRRTEGMDELLQKARKRETDAEQLLADIKDLEHRQQIDGLEPLVKRFMKLKPGNAYGKRLLTALQSYSKTPASRRSYHYDKGRLQPMPEPGFLRQWALLGSLVGVLVFLSVYCYVIFYLKSGNQTLAVHVDDAWLREQGGEVTLLVDGNSHTISTKTADGEDVSVVVTLGEHTFSVKHGDTVVHDPRTFQIEKDGRRILQITATDIQLTNQTENAKFIAAGVAGTSAKGTSKPSAPQKADLAKVDAARAGSESAQGGEQKVPVQADWVSLFDGKTLGGWDGDPRVWSVQDGAITGKTTEEVTLDKNSCIIWRGGETDNFELELEYRIVNGNSGIHYRSFELPEGEWRIGGYQADIDSGDKYSGMLYEEAARKILAEPGQSTEVGRNGEKHEVKVTGKAGDSAEIQKNILKEDWNKYRIVAQGYHFQHFINDMKAADVTDNDPRDRRAAGLLALQLHVGPPMTVQFRNIRMKQLRTIATGAAPATGIKDAPANESLKYSSQVHGASKQQLIAWADNLPEGYRPSWISVRATEKHPLFDAVAIESTDHGDWSWEFFDPMDKELWVPFDRKMAARRMELWVEYMSGGKIEKLVVWSDGEPAIAVRGGMDAIQTSLQMHKDKVRGTETLLPKGLTARDGYYLLFCTYEPTVQCQAELSLSYDELLTKVDEYRKKGWRPQLVDSILYSSPQRYLAVFVENPRAEKWDFSPRLTTNDYRQQLSTVDSSGGRPRCVCSREENGEIYYSVVWDFPVSPKAKAPPIADNDFQAVAPFNTARAKKFQEACAAHLKLPVEYTNSIGMKFRLIPPGRFTMGSTAEQIAAIRPHLDSSQDELRPSRIESEGPTQVVTLTRPFYLGVTEVTQLQFKTVVGRNPSAYCPEGRRKESAVNEDRSNTPVESVTWVDTGEFCNRLSAHERLDSAYQINPDVITQTGTGGYRLPTEAEWEFACRAGSTTLFSSGDDDESLKTIAWFSGNNTSGKPNPVAALLPNSFGLFDMHGNAWEQVHDAWRPDTYQRLEGAAAVDPRVDVGVDGSRVVRGGSHWMSSVECRSACRDVVAEGSYWGATGFRVALSVDAVRQFQTAKDSGNDK